MNPTSISALLERLESELQTADGRCVKLCRDANGGYRVIDGAERILPLGVFATECAVAARQACARERAQAMRELVLWAKRAILGVLPALRTGTQFAHP